MTSFDDLLDAAQTRPHIDFDVNLDRGSADRIAELEEELDGLGPDLRLGDGRPAELRARIDELREASAASFVTFRFTALTGPEWAALTDPSIARPNVGIDLHYGYNFQEVSQAAAVKSGGRLVDGKVEPLTEEQWGKLWSALSGHEFRRLIEAVWALNEFTPQQELESAKKASRARTAATSNSP